MNKSLYPKIRPGHLKPDLTQEKVKSLLAAEDRYTETYSHLSGRITENEAYMEKIRQTFLNNNLPSESLKQLHSVAPS